MIDPWSLAVDDKGRVFTYDYARRRIVRTNEDGSDWLESRPVDKLVTLHVDRKRGRLYHGSFENTDCWDLDGEGWVEREVDHSALVGDVIYEFKLSPDGLSAHYIYILPG